MTTLLSTRPLPETTAIYRYMAVNSFLHFFNNSALVLQRISNWPDFFEGKRFEFFKQHDLIPTGSASRDYLGSCWTLQIDDQRLYDSEDSYQ